MPQVFSSLNSKIYKVILTEVTSGSAVTTCFSAGKYLFCLNSISPVIERELPQDINYKYFGRTPNSRNFPFALRII